jgi:hypothetical protein
LRIRRFAAAAVAVAAVAAVPSAALGQTIQPGASTEADGSYCTLNWIYTGGGKYYGGTAAHCISGVGQTVNLASGSLGEVLFPIGRVAFVGPSLDYAFIELLPSVLGQVSPRMKGHPQYPTGVSTTSTARQGDIIQFSGNGVGFHLLPATQEQRIGVLNCNNGVEHNVLGPVISGDSGGPVGDQTDGFKALGIVNTVGAGVDTGCNLTAVHVGEGGLSLQGILADAAANGFSVRLVTANETVG